MLTQLNHSHSAPAAFAATCRDPAARSLLAHTVIDLTMQRNDIADYLGLTFETVSRILKVFKDTRIIRLSSVVEVLNLPALQRLAR